MEESAIRMIAQMISLNRIEVLLLKQEEEPYKGYWVLPTTYVSIHETCMEAITRVLEEKSHFTDLELEEVSTCSTPDRMLDVPVMAVSYLGFMSDLEALKLTTEVSFETKWFDIHELPKIGYDHQEILQGEGLPAGGCGCPDQAGYRHQKRHQGEFRGRQGKQGQDKEDNLRGERQCQGGEARQGDEEDQGQQAHQFLQFKEIQREGIRQRQEKPHQRLQRGRIQGCKNHQGFHILHGT